jgi:DNA adenine methylase
LARQIFQWSEVIQSVDFYNIDYRYCLQDVRKGDFVFLDPPYGGNKDRYTRQEFHLQDFYTELDRLNRIGVRWMLTFDGTAGNREYSFVPPSDLYQQRFFIKTGNSAFTKLMEQRKDSIQESVYLNVQPLHLTGDLFQYTAEHLTVGVR